jgi:hypothetical protein
MQITLLEMLAQYGSILQDRLFPRLEEALGPLPEKHRQLVKVLGLLEIDRWIPSRRGRVGRPQRDRRAIARAFVAKAVCNFGTTSALRDHLRTDAALRRICGWENVRRVPDESVFSRAFAEFARTELPQQVHAALIVKTQAERLIGHVSRDSTAIAARERPVKPTETVEESRAKAARAKEPRPPRRSKQPRKQTRTERQVSMTLPAMLAELPRHCAIGCKTNSHGRKETWRGYKLHLDAADGQIPISCLLTSASLHDSQVAIPLATLTATRVTSLYDLMDSAYDSELIQQHSRGLGHVPIIDSQARRFKPARPMLPHEAARFRERTTVERVNARLKDEFGGRTVRVRGALKVMAHLMFGILALTADQILRLSP